MLLIVLFPDLKSGYMGVFTLQKLGELTSQTTPSQLIIFSPHQPSFWASEMLHVFPSQNLCMSATQDTAQTASPGSFSPSTFWLSFKKPP